MARDKLLLPKAERLVFLALIEEMGDTGPSYTRNIARLRMTEFVRKNGKEACDQFYRHHFKEEPPK